MGHSLRYEVNCSILFTELPLLERPAAAKAAGFDAVEFWWPFATAVPADADVDAFVRAIDDAGVSADRAELLRRRHAGRRPRSGVLAGPVARSSATTSSSPSHRGAAGLQGLQRAVRQPGGRRRAPSEQDELAAENLALAAQGVAGIGGTVLVEPVSGAPRYPLLTAADVVRGDRPGAPPTAGRRTSASWPTCTTWPSTATTSTRRSPPTPERRGLAHVQIADAPAAANPAPASSTLDRQLSDLAGRRLPRLGRPGIQADHRHPADSRRPRSTGCPRDRRGAAA